MPATADPIIASIASTFTGLGYTVKTATEPKLMEWDGTPPQVRICPLGRGAVEWHSFRHRNLQERYQVVYVKDNNLDPTLDNNVNQFKLDTVDNFHGANSALLAVPGVWQSVVIDDVEYDRSLLPEGYNYSVCLIDVDWIES